jgi:DNA-binding Lrp family transcriptional regulator
MKKDNKLVQLDRLDLEILKLLLVDSRINISDMANKLEVSRPTIRKRLKKLLENNIIKRFTVEISDEIIGGIHVFYRFKTIDPKELLNYLKDKHEIIGIYVTSGEKNIVAEAVYPNLDSFRSNMNEFLEKNISFEADIVLRKIRKKEHYIPIIQFKLTCDYCGKEILDKPLEYTLYNRDFYFCCQTCLNNFRRMRE